jgi:alpha-galactosidase
VKVHPYVLVGAGAAAALAACSSSEARPEAPAAPAPAAAPTHATCKLRRGAADLGVDLVVEPASPDCGARVTATLRVATGDPKAPRWTSAAESPVAVEGAWQETDSGLVRKVSVRNTSAATVALVGLEWTFDVAAVAADRFFHDGYQSWAYTGLEAIPPSLEEERGTFRHGGTPGDTLDERSGVGFWVGALVGKRGRGIVAGADGGTVFKTAIAADGARLRLLEGGDLESIDLAPGASRALDGVFVGMGDVVGALDAYAGVVAAAHPPVKPRKPALGGWGSWNLYYSKVTAANMREEAAWAKTELVSRGLRDFLLDDGYEPRWGRWSAKPEFGASLDELAREQTSQGLVPAIWVAPFVVDARDPVVAEHPEYFVGDGSGRPKILPIVGNADMAVLDPTSEGARTFLRAQLEALVAAGYRTFKLDFLYAGALPGVRKEPTTGLESYARLFGIVREALGDAHVVGCGAPLVPTVGWTDSFRTGPDIAFELSPEPFYSILLAQARHSAMRAFTDRFWSLDPDVLLLRGSRIDDAEAWTTTVVTALSGGNYLLGDGRQAGAARLAMALSPALLPFTRDGRAARPDDLDDAGFDDRMIPSPLFDGPGTTAVPHVWRKTTADGKGEIVAVFGWSAEPFDARVALPSGAQEIGPDGARTPAPADGHVVVPRHGARLFVRSP